MNGLDIGLAFIEGVALIASPCILPVLPLVLSTSVSGGRTRPFGIILGFVAAFSAFVLLSRQVVEALHVDPDTIRYVSLGLLFALGMVLLSDKLSEGFGRLTQGAADFGGEFGAEGKGGFTSGIAIGGLIGLVWTPCAGPILAAVLVQVIRQQTNAQGVFVTLAFALGAGIPMLAIALAGQSIMRRFGFLARHTSAARKVFAVLILASVAYLGFGDSLLALFSRSAPSEAQTQDRLEDPLPSPYPAPDFVGIQEWVNGPPLMMSSLRGKVVLVDFWTYSCINCVRTLPYITAWDRQYRDKGLVIIGVHSPEFEFEKNITNIKTAVAHNGIAYPVAVDSNLATWLNFDNHYWPAHYLIDKNGMVVYTHFGEGHYDITENNIRYLLGMKDKAETRPTSPPSVADQTPETYLGFARADRFVGNPSLQVRAEVIYQIENSLPEHHWSLGGTWKVDGEKIIAQGSDSLLRLNFTARKVFLVMGTTDGKPQKIKLTLNGKPLGDSAGKDTEDNAVTVTAHTLYELVNQSKPQNGVLEIEASHPGFEAYAFTFGN